MGTLITGEDMIDSLGPPVARKGTCAVKQPSGRLCGVATVAYDNGDVRLSWCAAGHVGILDRNISVAGVEDETILLYYLG